MAEKKSIRTIFKFILSTVGVVILLVGAFNLFTEASPGNNAMLRQTIGIIAIVFWSGLLIWAAVRFFKNM